MTMVSKFIDIVCYHLDDSRQHRPFFNNLGINMSLATAYERLVVTSSFQGCRPMKSVDAKLISLFHSTPPLRSRGAATSNRTTNNRCKTYGFANAAKASLKGL